MGDGDGAQTIHHDFAAWAKVAARLHARTPMEVLQILGALGLRDSWSEIDSYWCRRLVDAIGNGDMQLVFEFSQLCADDLANRANEPPFELPRAAPPTTPAPAAKPSAATEQPLPPPVAAATTKKGRRTSAMHIAPSAANLVEGGDELDFRHHALLGFVAAGDHPPRSRQESHAALADALDQSQLLPPLDGQSETMAVDSEGYNTEVDAIVTAQQWRLEQYAHFCAELEVYDNQAVARRYGLMTDSAFQYVQTTWARRLADDQDARARWSEVLANARKVLGGDSWPS